MNKRVKKRNYIGLPSEYRKLYDEIARFIPEPRLLIDPFWTLAYGNDASCYRLIPKIVIKTVDRHEVAQILKSANRSGIPVTFRAAGTSLSGQAVTDSVLVLLAGAWKKCRVHGNGERITLEPGVIGAEANGRLAPYGRKIGPDPASINSCMIGGIAANNASGMCCGTAQNSYRTVESMTLILPDGTMLDTGDPGSRRSFARTQGALIAEIERIRDEINGDRELRQRIAQKYRIKNTTGYSINAFIDYTDPFDILLHLMIGSEGTLAFNAEITYRTVEEPPHKASSLIIFPDMESACTAAIILKQEPVSAAELMDRASLRSVENREGLPVYLRSLAPDAAALLVETRAGDTRTLLGQVERIQRSLHTVPTVFPVAFTDKKQEYEVLWDVRRGLFPAVGGTRRTGTTVIIEDVAFPIERLAEAAIGLERLMKRHGYDEGIIFGHALDGNLHFVFTQDFGLPEEVEKYRRFMEDMTVMVVEKYDGSLKGEHGTGRNMAPFVEREWGEKAYRLMRRIKRAFDPNAILNPGVLLNDHRTVHLENLKALPRTHEIVDKCIECGFCEAKCPSGNVTTTPRQRIVVRREISRLRSSGENAGRLKALEDGYVYLGEQTCAVDGLCATSCPVTINTGDYTRHLRSQQNGKGASSVAHWMAGHYGTTLSAVRLGLKSANLAHAVLGTSLMSGIAAGVRAFSKGAIPLWNPYMPKGISTPKLKDRIKGSGRKVVYFPSCIARTMGPAKDDDGQRHVFEAMLSVLDKARYDVLFPPALERLCCGLSFESKGFFKQADSLARELEKALLACSREGEYPILCDTSPCLYRMRRSFQSKLRLFEPVEFIHTNLMDRLEFRKIPEKIAVHVTCSSTKMGLGEKFKALARACAEEVVVPDNVDCCGFAGDRGFLHPELNKAALARLKPSLPPGCSSGYSNSRTCEIGLSLHGGVHYRSIVCLVDRCTVPLPEKKPAGPVLTGPAAII